MIQSSSVFFRQIFESTQKKFKTEQKKNKEKIIKECYLRKNLSRFEI
jgi:hypothetical protein